MITYEDFVLYIEPMKQTTSYEYAKDCYHKMLKAGRNPPPKLLLESFEWACCYYAWYERVAELCALVKTRTN